MKKKLLISVPVILAFYLLYDFIANKLGNAREITCFSSMGKLGQALRQYASDYDDVYPYRKAWEIDLPKKYPEIYCPSAKTKISEVKNVGFYGYALNNSFLILKSSSIPFPKSTVMVFESAAGILSGASPKLFPGINPDNLSLEKGWLRHRGGSNYLFADGHVRWHEVREVFAANDYNGNDGIYPSFNVWFGIKQIRERSK